MRADLRAKLERLCREAWDISEGDINSGGCAGFAGLVGAIAAAHSARAWVHLCSREWDADDIRRTWAKGGNTPEDVRCAHVVCCVLIGGEVFAVDAEHGVMAVTRYVRKVWRSHGLIVHTSFRVPWRMVWRAYKVKRLWNSWFDRRHMRAIVRRARRMFVRFSSIHA